MLPTQKNSPKRRPYEGLWWPVGSLAISVTHNPIVTFSCEVSEARGPGPTARKSDRVVFGPNVYKVRIPIGRALTAGMVGDQLMPKACCGGCGRCCGSRYSSAGPGSRGSGLGGDQPHYRDRAKRQAVEPRHKRIARAAGEVRARVGRRVHGLSARDGKRPSGDVDLFTAGSTAASFPS